MGYSNHSVSQSVSYASDRPREKENNTVTVRRVKRNTDRTLAGRGAVARERVAGVRNSNRVVLRQNLEHELGTRRGQQRTAG